MSKSKIDGNDVFAIKNINKGDIITFYPPHIIGFLPFKDRTVEKHIVSLIFSKNCKRTQTEAKELYDYRIYSYDIGDPDLNNDPNFLGHFINDASSLCENYIQISQMNEL